MARKRVVPFLRGMGAKEDFVTESFVPSEEYKAQQMAMVRSLIAAGFDPEQVASMFLVPFDLLSIKKPEDV
jgi:hypothetical protein